MPLPKPQLRLSSLLVLMLLAGVLFAWYADHRQQLNRQQTLAVEVKMQGAQIADLKKRVNQRGFGGQVVYFWANADEYIEALLHADDNAFLDKAPSFVSADEVVFKDGMAQVIQLLDSDVPKEAGRAAEVVSLMLMQSKQRMEPFAEQAIEKLTRHLNDPDPGYPVTLLGRFGPQAKAALPDLKKIMRDDKHPYAVYATISVAKIDPSEDINPRLIEFIEMKHRSWYEASMELAQRGPADVARKVISKRYEAAQNDGERNMAVQALNQIKPE